MSTPLRVNDTLFREAEAEGAFMRRSAAKQVEFWAELGKTLSQSVTNTELLALMQGIAKVRIDLPVTAAIDPQAIFDQVNKSRQAGDLGQAITQNQLYYEASHQNPGLLDEVTPNGKRRTGRFIDGKFVEE